MTFQDPCAETQFTIDPTILSSLAITYALYSGVYSETLDTSLITLSPTVPDGITCPDLLLWLMYDETDVGTYTAISTDYEIQGYVYIVQSSPPKLEFSTLGEAYNSNDLLRTHSMRLCVKYNDNTYTNVGDLDFTIAFEDPCLDVEFVLGVGLKPENMQFTAGQAAMIHSFLGYESYVTITSSSGEDMSDCGPTLILRLAVYDSSDNSLTWHDTWSSRGFSQFEY